MSIRPKSKVLENICFTKSESAGKAYSHYSADLGTIGGKRVRIHASSLSECRKRVDEWYEQRKSAGDGIATLSMKELADATLAFDKLRSSKCDKTLYEIVCNFLERNGAGLNRTLLTDAYDLYFSRLTDAQDTQKQIVRVRIGRFVAKFPQKRVDEITTEMVKRYLAELGDVSPKTWNNNMEYIRTFFNWCAKKTNGFCLDNPLSDIEKRKGAAKIPECATVSATREFLEKVRAWDSPYRDAMLLRCVLNYFGGMRVAETCRQLVEDVRVEDGSILVRNPKGCQTGRVSYRTFRIEDCGPALSLWLKEIDMQKAERTRLSAGNYKKLVGELRKGCKSAIPPNAGRHSFISYHVAAYGDPKRTEAIVGTSEEMRKGNYQTLMTKADGEAYFAIAPSPRASHS